MSHDINPYKILKVESNANIEQIKRSYRKLCLKYHPDKLINSSLKEQEESSKRFENIQLAHSILTDEKKRKVFDKTGSLKEINCDFNWFEYFSQVKIEINKEIIIKDKKQYQGSKEEEEDIIKSWIDIKGDFLSLFEIIPHLEPNKIEEKRIFNKIEELIKKKVIKTNDLWEIYKKDRIKLFNKYKKSLKSEEKEANELKKELSKKHKLAQMDTEDDLKQLIQKKNKNSLDDLIQRLENKYNKKV